MEENSAIYISPRKARVVSKGGLLYNYLISHRILILIRFLPPHQATVAQELFICFQWGPRKTHKNSMISCGLWEERRAAGSVWGHKTATKPR